MHMHENRLSFLAAAGAARPVLALADTGRRWLEPSALAEMTIGALSAHLVRAVTDVEAALQQHVKDVEDPMSAGAYFAGIRREPSSPRNVEVRKRSAEIAREGHRAVLDHLDRGVEALRARLAHEADRLVEVAGGYVLDLDDYLATRIVELVVHTDDLCVSLERSTPPLPGIDVAIATLVDAASFRHGELGVLRALTRRERDSGEALRVL